MDTLKVAFDTLIVGALALPWLVVLLRMYVSPAVGTLDWPPAGLSVLPKETRAAVFSVVIVAFGYILGSAVSRISDDFFGDDELVRLPTEPSIRAKVYYSEYCQSPSPLKFCRSKDRRNSQMSWNSSGGRRVSCCCKVKTRLLVCARCMTSL